MLPFMSSPELFTSNYITSSGSSLMLYTGTTTKRFGFTLSYDSAEPSWEPYVIFVFGYDGTVTSDLYIYKIDTKDGSYEQLTLPVS